jgi:phage recombination protein Bet
MSSALPQVRPAPPPAESPWSDEEVQLIRRTLAPRATEEEFKLFLYRARVMGLDPLKREIYFVKYGSEPGTIVVGIDGFRVRASRTGAHRGTKRGIIRDEKGKCTGAWAEVYRADWKEPAREEVALAEYNTGRANWAKMPETMIKKVAEAAALRIAFPDELGGVYAPEEMDQAERSDARTEAVQAALDKQAEPAPAAEVLPPAEPKPEYVVPMGQWAGKPLRDIDRNALADYCIAKREEAERTKKKIGGALKELIERAEAYLSEAQ